MMEWYNTLEKLPKNKDHVLICYETETGKFNYSLASYFDFDGMAKDKVFIFLGNFYVQYFNGEPSVCQYIPLEKVAYWTPFLFIQPERLSEKTPQKGDAIV